MIKTHIAILTPAIVAFAVSGCGGGGDSSKPLTRSELTKKANAICHRVVAELRSGSNQAYSRADVARVAPRLASVDRDVVGELRQLTPPAELASDWQHVIVGAEALADHMAKFGQYAKTNSLRQGARDLAADAAKVQEQLIATAKRDGFTDCTEVS